VVSQRQSGKFDRWPLVDRPEAVSTAGVRNIGLVIDRIAQQPERSHYIETVFE
jgi:hypothetical protein